MRDGLGALCSLQLWHKEGEPAKGRFEIEVCRKQLGFIGVGGFFCEFIFKVNLACSQEAITIILGHGC